MFNERMRTLDGRRYSVWEREPRKYEEATAIRFAQKWVVEANTGCHLWIGARNAKGYGTLSYKGKTAAAHRWSYEQTKGAIPKGLQIDHLCRTPLCVNPDHLEAVTHLVNTRRGNVGMNSSAKTHCPQGHEYDEYNTLVYSGKRVCRACKKERNANRPKKGKPQDVLHRL